MLKQICNKRLKAGHFTGRTASFIKFETENDGIPKQAGSTLPFAI